MAHIIDFNSGTRHPMVATFGLGPSVAKDVSFVSLAHDALEEHLIRALRQALPCVLVPAEKRSIFGEHVVFPIALWGNSVDAVVRVEVAPWELLDVSEFSTWCPRRDPFLLYAAAVAARIR